MPLSWFDIAAVAAERRTLLWWHWASPCLNTGTGGRTTARCQGPWPGVALGHSSGQQSTTWSSKVPAASCPCHLGSCTIPPYLECSGQRCERQWGREQVGASIIHLLSSHITQVSTHISTYLPAFHSITLHPHFKHQIIWSIKIVWIFLLHICLFPG